MTERGQRAVRYMLEGLSLVLMALALVILLQASRPASAYTPPPPVGDWVISDLTIQHDPVSLTGDLIITSNGTLVLSGTTLTVNCPQGLEYGILVEGGGTLRASNCDIAASDLDAPFSFFIKPSANVELDECALRGVGKFSPTQTSWGLFVQSTNTTLTGCRISSCNVGVFVYGSVSPKILDCDITNNSDRGIWCKYSSPLISGNRLSGNEYGIYLENGSRPVLLNNDLRDNRRLAVHMDAGCVVDWSINTACEWERSELLLRGNLTVEPGGALRVSASAIELGSTGGPAPPTVRVLSGGSLSLLAGSRLDHQGGSAFYRFVVEKGGALEVVGSAVHRAGTSSSEAWTAGPCVEGTASISGANLSGNLNSLVCINTTVHLNDTVLGGASSDLWLERSTAFLANVTFSRERVRFEDNASALHVAWYLSVAALWQNGAPVRGAVFAVLHDKGGVVVQGPFGPDGWMRSIKLEETVLSLDGAKDRSNYTVRATPARGASTERQVRMTTNLACMFTFTDTVAPHVQVLSPESGSGLNRTWLVVSGTASDDNGLASVETRLDQSPRWTAVAPGDWSINLTNLTRGEHRLQARATDEAGNAALANITFLVDLEAPKLELDEPFDAESLTREGSVRFRGRTEALSNLTINGREVEVLSDGSFDARIDLPEGPNTVVLVSHDRGGNTAILLRTVTVDLSPPPITVLSPPNGTRTRLAEIQLSGRVEPGARFRVDGSTVELAPDGSFNTTVLLSGGPKTLELQAEDRAGNSNTTTWTLVRDVDEARGPAGFLERNGPLLAAGIILVVALAATFLAFVVRRRARKPPSPRREAGPAAVGAPSGERAGPSAAPAPGGGATSADEILYGPGGRGGQK